jgi:hypothetical protein
VKNKNLGLKKLVSRNMKSAMEHKVSRVDSCNFDEDMSEHFELTRKSEIVPEGWYSSRKPKTGKIANNTVRISVVSSNPYKINEAPK